ncbi:MAG TPA: type II secretion system protein [Patescibacteria group bacterium]|nr:type II secretion system protein [Patescibacteria group bacterium]
MVKIRSGFTLIELLIVIAILGVLAVVVFVAINPAERQAQARDTGRISSVTQIGHSLQGFYTVGTAYPNVATWAQELIDHGELSTFPAGINYNINGITACTEYVQPALDGTYCYNEDQANGNGAIVYSKAEATANRDDCTSPEEAYFVFSTVDGRGGTICSDGDPFPWTAGTQTYVNN